MKTTVKFRFPFLLSLAFLIFGISSCTTENVLEENQDPIIGKWYLISVNDSDVSNVDCYRDSFVESNEETITFFLQDRLEDGTCETVLDQTQALKNEEGFYYLGDEVIEIYIDAQVLTWRVDRETTLEFRK